MRHLLSRLGLRVGVVLAIVVFIAGAVAVGKVLGRNNPPTSSFINGEPPSASPGLVTTGPAENDDGVRTPPPTVPVAEAGDLKVRVDEFMTAWLHRDRTPQAWHDAIAKLSTPALTKSLEGVDPLSVPATRVVAAPSFPVLTATFAQAVIPVDSGTVTLTLLKQANEWLVDGVDWDRA